MFSRRNTLFSVVSAALCASATWATLLNVTPGLPLATYNSTGITNYDSVNNVLSINATPLFFLPAAGPPSPIFPSSSGLVQLSIALQVDGAGNLIGGVVGDDFVFEGAVPGFNGILLTGEVVAFGWEDTTPGSTIGTDLFDVIFSVTGGLLAGQYAGMDIGVTVTSENSNFAGDFAVDFNGGAKGNIGPVPAVVFCDLQVDKQACVILPLASPDDACDGKLLDITLRYTGDGCEMLDHFQSPDKVSCAGDPIDAPLVRMLVTDKTGSFIYADVPEVPLDGEITASASNAGLVDFESETHVTIFNMDGLVLQEIVFHTSCSQPLAPGNQFGSVFVQELTSTNGGTVVYEPSTNDCISEFLPSLGGGCDGKLVNILLQFTGGDCLQSNHSQDASNSHDGDDDDEHAGVQCDGDAGFGPVRILVTNKEGDRVYADIANIPLDGIVLASASNAGSGKIDKETRVRIYDINDTLLQSIMFHTSCSQPIDIGDQFGSVRIIGLQSTNGGAFSMYADVDYTYTVTNNGTGAVTDVAVIDDLLGDVAGGLIPVLLPGEAVEFTVPAFVFETTTNYVTASGYSGSTLCEATSFATVTFLEPPISIDCCDSGNKLQSIVVTYTGDNCSANMHSQDSRKVSCEGDPEFADPVYIIATNKEHFDHEEDEAKIWFEGQVSLGSQFIIDAANEGKDKLKSKTFVHIFDMNGDWLQTVEFHTSCSQPLALGDQFGSIQINGCDQEGGPTEGLFCNGHAKPQSITMEYSGADCSASNHSQDADKVSCVGDPALMPVVRILALSKETPSDSDAKVWFDGTVLLGDLFVIDAANAGKSKLKSRTYVFIYDLDGTLLQQLEFHTSCSQPLNMNDQFGSLILRDLIAE